MGIPIQKEADSKPLITEYVFRLLAKEKTEDQNKHRSLQRVIPIYLSSS